MAKGFNLWLCWVAHLIGLPEMRQVLEWQEQDYQRICERPQNGKEEGGNKDDDVQK